MNDTRRLAVLAAPLVWLAPLGVCAPVEKSRLADVVKIEFPKGGYKLTLAEVAKGVKLKYKVVVARDVEGVVALGTPPSYHEPAGPSGLHPHESITGKGQSYSLVDFGLAPPPREVAKKLKKGSYEHSFEWDGRNWSGPSDFGNPKGKPFPAGTYEVTVTIRGKLVTDKGKVPYEIREKTKLVLK